MATSEGTVEITVGKTSYVLNAGDSACFKSELRHGYRTVGTKPARAIVINTPLTFQGEEHRRKPGRDVRAFRSSC
jgi:quercetin dioxygenase-like cupin family protein